MTHEPTKIVWLFAGNTEVDSMVNMARDFFLPQFPDEWSSARHIMYSNVKECVHFGGDSYYVEPAPWRDDMGTLIGKAREVYLTAHLEGDIEDADMIITNSQYVATLAQLMKFSGPSRKGKKIAASPIVYICPKVEEGDDYEILPPHNDIYWWVLASYPNQWLAVLDSDWEVTSATELLRSVKPRARVDRIKRLVFFKWEGFINPDDKKVDRIVWQGRNNNDKGIRTSFEILSVLSGLGYDCEAYISSSSGHGAINLGQMAKVLKINRGLVQSDYFEGIKDAKVCPITSNSEAWPPGYFEMIQRGIIPVILKRPWMRTFLTDKWPLVFKTVPEAVEMCREAVTDYDYYRDLLDRCMSERYSTQPNFSELLTNIWDMYLVDNHRAFSVNSK